MLPLLVVASLVSSVNPGCRVIVLNLQGKGLPDTEKEIPELLTETLAGELATASGCHVISQQDVGQMLNFEASKAECSDGNDSCLAEIGTALGADRVVGGAVGKIGSEFVISARLLDVEKGTVDARAEQAVSGDPAQLRRAAKNVGRRLFKVADLPPEAAVDSTPLTKPVEPAPTPSTGPSPLLIAGGVVGGLGVVAFGAGAALAVLANLRLSDPKATQKDAIQTQGLVAAGVAGVGALVAITGGVLVGVALLSE
jgi:hypothetical protein